MDKTSVYACYRMNDRMTDTSVEDKNVTNVISNCISSKYK